MKRLLLSGLALSALAPLSSAQAALTIFTDRDAYIAALGGSLVEEDFESLLVDTYFDTQTVQFDHFSVGYSGVLRHNTFNLIDVLPEASINNVYESNALIGGVLNGEAVTFTFNNEAYAFGGDWARINDTVARSVFEVAGQTFDLGLDFDGFWGVISDDPFDTFQVVGLGQPEGFGLDDAAFAVTPAAPVPVPAAGLLFAGGLFAAYRRAKSQRG